jgi:hypothetical protein
MSTCTPEIKQTLLYALERTRDDSLERAQWAFKGMTAQQMQELHGASGYTRQRVLDGYQRAADLNEAARRWVLSL